MDGNTSHKAESLLGLVYLEQYNHFSGNLSVLSFDPSTVYAVIQMRMTFRTIWFLDIDEIAHC